MDPLTPDAGMPETAPVEPQVETAQPAPTVAPEVRAPADLWQTQSTDSEPTTFHAFGFDVEAPKAWHVATGGLGGILWAAQQLKHNVTDPFVDKVQGYLATQLERPLSDAGKVEGSDAVPSPVDMAKGVGGALGAATAKLSRQSPEAGMQGGEALGEYMLKSGLRQFIGRAPLENLSDDKKARAMRELDMLNRSPVIASALRAMNAPFLASAIENNPDQAADLMGAGEEFLTGEATMLPFYLVSPGKLAALKGLGPVTGGIAQGAASGAQMTGAMAMMTPGARIDDAVVTGAAIGAVPGALVGAGKAYVEGKALNAAAEEARFAGAKDITPAKTEAPKLTVGGENPGLPMEPVAPKPPPKPGPIVVGMTSDALDAMAVDVHEAARMREAASRGTALAGLKPGEKWTEVPRGNTSFKPNMVTLDIEPNGVPTVRAVGFGPSGPERGMTIEIRTVADAAEVAALSKKWGMAPQASQEATAAFNPLIRQAISDPSFKPKKQQLKTTESTKSDSPVARLRTSIETRTADAPEVQQPVERSPGYMIFQPEADPSKQFGGVSGLPQVHQLNDPIQRVQNLRDRTLVKVTLPNGEFRYGFALTDTKEGGFVIQAPAPAEGIPNSLLHNVEVPRSRIEKIEDAELETLGTAEPEALIAERELYRRARPAKTVDEFIENFLTWQAKQPESVQQLIKDYTKRDLRMVNKVPEKGIGVIQEPNAVAAQSEAKRGQVRLLLARQGINGQLGAHLLHVTNKLSAGLPITPAERKLVTEEWQNAQKALQGSELNQVSELGPVPDVIGKPDLTDTQPGVRDLNQGDHVALASGEVGEVKALTADESTAVVNINGALKTVPTEQIIGNVPAPVEGSLTPPYSKVEDVVVDLHKARDVHQGDPTAIDVAEGDVIAHARNSGISDNEIAKALDAERPTNSTPAESPTVVAPPPVPPPPVNGLAGGGAAPPPPPAGVPSSLTLLNRVWKGIQQADRLFTPAYSRGPQDTAQAALIMSSLKPLEQTTKAAVYANLDKLYGPRTPEYLEDLNKYIEGDQGRLSTQAFLLKYPESSMQMLQQTDALKAYSQKLEEKGLALGMFEEHQKDLKSIDPVHLSNFFLKWNMPPGAWAKEFTKQAGKFDALVNAVKTIEFTPEQRLQMGPQALNDRAREMAYDIIGMWDEPSAASGGHATPAGATKSLMQRNDELPAIYKEAMGFISDPAARIAETIARQEALVAMGTVWSEVRSNMDIKLNPTTGISSEFEPAPDPLWGPWRILRGAKYGQMNGRYLHPAAYEALVSSWQFPTRTRTFANSIMDFIKRNRTIYNPNAWVTNFLSNTQGAMLSGALDPILAPQRTARAVLDALSLLTGPGRGDPTSPAGQVLMRARRVGMFTPGQAGTDMIVSDFARMLEKQALGNPKWGVMDLMKSLGERGIGEANGFTKKVGALYDANDQAWKMADWLANVEKGGKNPAKFLGDQWTPTLAPERVAELIDREAARRVACSYPMPHAPSQAAHFLRSSGAGALGAANPFMAITLEQGRILANLPRRMAGQGGESSAEFAGKMIKYGAFVATLGIGAYYIARKNGISPAQQDLAMKSMSTSQQQYRPGLIPLWYRDYTGNPRFLDLTNNFDALRLMQGPPESNVHSRMFYNAMKTPISGGPLEDWFDRTARASGFNAAPEGFESKANPMQLEGWKAWADAAAQAGLAPSFMSSVPKALNAGGMLGTPPKNPYDRLSKTEALLKAAGVPIVPGGDPIAKVRELQFKEQDAQKAYIRAHRPAEGDLPGVRSLGMQKMKEDLINKTKKDMDSSIKSLSDFSNLMKEAKKP